MPLSSAAPPMSTRSLRPRTDACGAGANSLTAVSAASSAAWREAPIAHPSQFISVRRASRSTAAGYPPTGCVATNSARMRVTGGAFVSAVTFVLFAISVGQLDGAVFGLYSPFRDVVANVLTELLRRHRHWLQRLAGQPIRKGRVGEHLVDLGVECGDDRG